MSIDIENPGADEWQLKAAIGNMTGMGFTHDPATTTGLTFGIGPGRIMFDANDDFSGWDVGVTVDLPDNTTCSIYIWPDRPSLQDAIIVKDTNGNFGYAPINVWHLYNVTTSGGEITSIEDYRSTVFAAFSTNGILNDLSVYDGGDNGDGTAYLQFKAGRIWTPAGVITPDPNIDGLPNDATSYVEVDESGVIVANQVGFTAGRFPLCEVHYQFVPGVISNIVDARAFMVWANGASGTFSTADSKTVTVVAGIITDISPA